MAHVKNAPRVDPGCPFLDLVRHHLGMAYDMERVAAALQDARTHIGWTQEELAARAGVHPSTVKNLEGRRAKIVRRWPSSIGPIERALGKPEGWARAIAEAPPGAPPTPGAKVIPLRGADLPPDDEFVRELRAMDIPDAWRDTIIHEYWKEKARETEELQDKYRRMARAAEG